MPFKGSQEKDVWVSTPQCPSDSPAFSFFIPTGLKLSLILLLESHDSNHLIQDTRAIFPSLHFAFVFPCGTKNVSFILNALIAPPLFKNQTGRSDDVP